MNNVFDINGGQPLPVEDPDGVDPTADERSPIDGMTDAERLIWWDGYNKGRDAEVARVLELTQAKLDEAMPASRPRLAVVS